MNEIQVNSSMHYTFSRYMHKQRWMGLWYQLAEVTRLQPDSVLEIGCGTGAFKAVAERFGLSVATLDIDPSLSPDHVGSVECIPAEDESYDLVCAFQILEHLPYERALVGLREMVRVSKRQLLISLPDARPAWPISVHVPGIGPRAFFINRPSWRPKKHVFDGEHYWEISKADFPLQRIVNDMRGCGMVVERTFRAPEMPYHRFFVARKCGR